MKAAIKLTLAVLLTVILCAVLVYTQNKAIAQAVDGLKQFSAPPVYAPQFYDI